MNDNARERILLNNLNENAHWDIDCKGPVIVHGVVGEDSQDPNSPSWFNPHEAFQVLLYFTRLMKSGISADDIGIITPYASQVNNNNYTPCHERRNPCPDKIATDCAHSPLI